MSSVTSETAPAGLEITCAKPDCHWRGSPADAPAHVCPTPAAASDEVAEPEEAAAAQPAGPFAGMTGADGRPIAGTVDEAHRFRVVWADGAGDSVVVGTAATEDEALAIVSATDAGKGTAEIVDLGPAQALLERDDVEAEPPAADSDPQTRADLEAWLLAHGDYDEQGVPQNERTATFDARLSAMLEQDDDEEPELDELADTVDGEPVVLEDSAAVEPEQEPELEDAGTGEAMTAIEVPVGETGTLEAAGAAEWQEQIADELERQTGVKDFRWLLISKDENGSASLIGRARVKSEAEELLVKTEDAGQLPGLEVVKTKDVLEAAAEIREKRRLIEEPETTVETPQETPAEPAEPAAEPEAAPEEETPETPEDPSGEALFDRSAYDREDLAIPKVDGQSIDRIAVSFSGSVMLDRSNPNDVALYNRLALGKDVELRVAGRVSGTGAKGATNREGDLDVIVGSKAIAVQTVYVLAPEEL